MGKFKVGDRVRRIGGAVGMCLIGQEVEVAEPDGDFVKNAIWYVNENGNKVWSSEIYWELVAHTTWAPVEGKYGRTRDGRKVGPIESQRGVWPFLGKIADTGSAAFNADGTCPYYPQSDLVAEWVEPATTASPVRLVPTIVDGNYGKLHLSSYDATRARISLDSIMSADDLTAAIATLTTVRDALREVA